jgi:hypothetical protein
VGQGSPGAGPVRHRLIFPSSIRLATFLVASRTRPLKEGTMRKIVIAMITTIFAVIGIGLASPAQATLGNSGSCDYGPGIARISVVEFPGEGDLSYVTVDSDDQLSVTLSTDKPYYNDGNTLITTGHFHSAPVDGDGYWNYQDNWNWDATSAYSTITKVVVFVRQYNSTNSCTKTVYI